MVLVGMQVYPETSRKNQDKPESHKEMQRRTGKCRLIQELPRKYRSLHNKKSCARNVQEPAGNYSIKKEKTGTYRAHGYGKVEFCLPTKLRPRLSRSRRHTQRLRLIRAHELGHPICIRATQFNLSSMAVLGAGNVRREKTT